MCLFMLYPKLIVLRRWKTQYRTLFSNFMTICMEEQNTMTGTILDWI